MDDKMVVVYDVCDEIERLFEILDEDEGFGDELGENLTFSDCVMPRLVDRLGDWSTEEMEEIDYTPAGWESAGERKLLGEERDFFANGHTLGRILAEGEEMPSLLQQLVIAERRGANAGRLSLGGQPNRQSAMTGAGADGGAATAFSVASAARRQSVATVSTARTVDRAMERDARRYDGGFLLG